MSNKTKLLKTVRKEIRSSANEIGRRMVEDLLALPFKERFKVAVNMVFKKQIFITK